MAVTAALSGAPQTELPPALWFLLEKGDGERWRRWGTCSPLPTQPYLTWRSWGLSPASPDTGLWMPYAIDRKVHCLWASTGRQICFSQFSDTEVFCLLDWYPSVLHSL